MQERTRREPVSVRKMRELRENLISTSLSTAQSPPDAYYLVDRRESIEYYKLCKLVGNDLFTPSWLL